MIKKFILIYNNLFKLKIDFLPPKRSDILIYDNTSVLNKFSSILFKKKNIEIFFCRYEKINFFILMKSILFFFKFRNLIKNYKFFYLKSVSPKVVYTSIDNNLAFFLLKDIYPHTTYIADQNGMRDNYFYDYAYNQKKKFKIKYKVDYYFVFGEYEKKRIKKIIDGNIIVCGNTKNNNYIAPKKKKEKIITYISSKIKTRLELEKKIFNHLILFSQKFNYKLFFLDRPSQNNNMLLKEVFKNKNWSYRNDKSLNNRYDLLNKSKIIIFAHSTLGYECMSRGYKCLALNNNQYNYSNQFNKKNGYFWCLPDNFKLVENKILKILSCETKKWEKDLKNYSRKILFFDPANLKKIKIINKILND